jgi:hypothetical protein
MSGVRRRLSPGGTDWAGNGGARVKGKMRRFGLAAQIAEARRSMRGWPKWMRKAAEQDLALMEAKGVKR